MSYGFPAPSGDLWVGSYLDDVLVLFVDEVRKFVHPAAPEDERPDLAEVRRLREARRKAGTRLHELKRLESVTSGVFWGAQFAEDGAISGELAARDHLCLLTAACCVSAVTWRELNQLVSTWTHHLMFRRRSLCLFSAI